MILDGIWRGIVRREPAEPQRVPPLRRLFGHLAEGSSIGARWRAPAESVEARVQRVVATQLGVGPEELTPEVSLADDLAADSLDLVELWLAFEDEFGIKVPERVLQGIGTYGDLVDAIQRLDEERRVAEADAQSGREPVFVWVRIVPPSRHANGDLLRGGWLTPYTTETIVQDAVRSGPGSRLEVSVPMNVSDAGLAELREEFAWLAERGIRVTVRRHGQPRAHYPEAAQRAG